MPLSLALALSAATVATPAPPARPICRVSRIEHADTAQKPHIATLGEMPPAKHIIAVLHTVDGCETPIVVNAEVGTNQR